MSKHMAKHLSKHWSIEEQRRLISEVNAGITDIAERHNVGDNEIRLRIQKIIYDGITGGKTIMYMAKILNYDPNKIKSYYDRYKQHIRRIEKNDAEQLYRLKRENKKLKKKIKILSEKYYNRCG